LYIDYQSKNLFQKYYLVIDFLRHLLFNIIFAAFYENPILQFCLFFFIQILFQINLITLNPFKTNLLFILACMYELLGDIALINTLILYIFYRTKYNNIKNKMLIGNINIIFFVKKKNYIISLKDIYFLFF